MFLHETRFISHAREGRIEIFQVARIIVARQADERFARRVG
jgi:hypothetical protein